MNPLAVLLPASALVLPLSALVLAGTTVSTPPPDRPESTVQAAPPFETPPSTSAAPDQGAPSAAPTLPAARAPGSPGLLGRWTWPLQPRPALVRPFLRPATTYGAGHRGVDLAGASGQEVRAVEAGVVTHVGSIAGRGTVSVLHASGIRSTYEPLAPEVVTGSAVARGGVLGRLQETGSHCVPALCLHLGAIRGDTYLDPMVFLQGGQRVRLLPMRQLPLGQAPEG